MALKNSKTGSLPVSEIYSFMKEHFPYFKVSLYRTILSVHMTVSTKRDGFSRTMPLTLLVEFCWMVRQHQMAGRTP